MWRSALFFFVRVCFFFVLSLSSPARSLFSLRSCSPVVGGFCSVHGCAAVARWFARTGRARRRVRWSVTVTPIRYSYSRRGPLRAYVAGYAACDGLQSR